jgi:hypothetical protein
MTDADGRCDDHDIVGCSTCERPLVLPATGPDFVTLWASLTPAQRRAITEGLPVGMDAIGRPSKPTLRALIRYGLAVEIGLDWPTVIVRTALGKALVAWVQEAA